MTPIIATLPADGSPIVADLAVERSGLTPGVAWPLLVALCSGGDVKAWTHEGVLWVRRVDSVVSSRADHMSRDKVLTSAMGLRKSERPGLAGPRRSRSER